MKETAIGKVNSPNKVGELILDDIFFDPTTFKYSGRKSQDWKEIR
jgi:hypothetical protein